MTAGMSGYRPHAGDVVTVDGRRVGDLGRLGEILEAAGEPGHERLRIRWEDGRESVLYPGGGNVRLRPRRGPRRGSGARQGGTV